MAWEDQEKLASKLASKVDPATSWSSQQLHTLWREGEITSAQPKEAVARNSRSGEESASYEASTTIAGQQLL